MRPRRSTSTSVSKNARLNAAATSGPSEDLPAPMKPARAMWRSSATAGDARGGACRAPKSSRVRAVFVLYLTLIWAGIMFYTVIGLTHH